MWCVGRILLATIVCYLPIKPHLGSMVSYGQGQMLHTLYSGQVAGERHPRATFVMRVVCSLSSPVGQSHKNASFFPFTNDTNASHSAKFVWLDLG